MDDITKTVDRTAAAGDCTRQVHLQCVVHLILHMTASTSLSHAWHRHPPTTVSAVSSQLYHWDRHNSQHISSALNNTHNTNVFNSDFLVDCENVTHISSLFRRLPPNGWNGRRPVAMWYNVTPILHRSTVAENCLHDGRLSTALSYMSGY